MAALDLGVLHPCNLDVRLGPPHDCLIESPRRPATSEFLRHQGFQDLLLEGVDDIIPTIVVVRIVSSQKQGQLVLRRRSSVCPTGGLAIPRRFGPVAGALRRACRRSGQPGSNRGGILVRSRLSSEAPLIVALARLPAPRLGIRLTPHVMATTSIGEIKERPWQCTLNNKLGFKG